MSPVVIAADIVSVAAIGISVWAARSARTYRHRANAALARQRAAALESARLRAAHRNGGTS